MTELLRKDAPSEATLVTCYQELCTTYRPFDDFRAKLLALLPFATGLGIFALLGKIGEVAREFLQPIGAFGFVITLGLFAYELFGIHKCHTLIKAGKRIEAYWQKVEDGQFAQRPHSLLGFVDEPFATGIVWPGVLASWFYLAQLSNPAAARLAAAVAFGAEFVGIMGYDIWPGIEGHRFNRKLEQGAKAVAKSDCGRGSEPADDGRA